MSSLYLLTGFLGAGKTTLLKEMIKIFRDERLAVIINEFGKIGVDGDILNGIGVPLSEISDGSIFCSCKLDQFEEVLLKTLQKEPEVIIIEASGLSNPQNLRKILEWPAFQGVELKGSICIADAVNFHKVVYSALACRHQLSIADLVILNKIDLVSRQSVEQTKDLISSIRPEVPIVEASFGKIEWRWIRELGSKNDGSDPLRQVQDITLQKFLLDVSPIKTREELMAFLSAFACSTYRIKGFVHMENVNFLVDAVGPDIKITAFDGNPAALNKLIVLSGNGLPALSGIREAIKKLGLSPDMLQ